jgi:hypothetical protein
MSWLWRSLLVTRGLDSEKEGQREEDRETGGVKPADEVLLWLGVTFLVLLLAFSGSTAGGNSSPSHDFSGVGFAPPVFLARWRTELDHSDAIGGNDAGSDEDYRDAGILLRPGAVARGEVPPPPIVTDLQGDGTVEVVFCHPGERSELVVLGAVGPDDDVPTTGRGLAIRGRGSVAPPGSVTSGYRVVAMATGFVDSPSVPSRKQVIAVVTSGWRVLCFDHQAKLLWESRVVDAFPPGLVLSEVSVVVSPTPLRTGDRGSVFVGGRLSSSATQGETTGTVAGGGHEHGQMGTRDDDHQNDTFATASNEADFTNSAFTQPHMSYVAFDAGTGKIRWEHRNNDFRPSEEEVSSGDEDVSPSRLGAHPKHDYDNLFLPRHSFQRHVVSSVGHGEVDWRVFGRDVLRHLPHAWQRRDDTTITMAHFDRHDRGEPPVRRGSARPSFGQGWSSKLGANRMESLSLGAVPHVELEHVSNPNVLVVHHRRGIEIVHAYTGRTLSQLPLEAEQDDESASIFADIIGDGSVDRVTAYGGLGGHASACKVRAVTGVPGIEEMYQAEICEQRKQKRASLGLFRASKSETGALDELRVVAPLAVDSAEARDNLRHVQQSLPPVDNIHASAEFATRLMRIASTARDGARRSKDIFTFVSSGRVTCVHPDGRVGWATPTEAVWGRAASRLKVHHIHETLYAKWKRNQNTKLAETSEANEQIKLPVVPSMQPFSVLSPHSAELPPKSALYSLLGLEEDPSLLLVAGIRVELLDTVTGERVCDASNMPPAAVPLAPVVIGDYNNDGRNDVLLLTARGLVGLRQVHSSTAASTLLLLPIVCALVILMLMMFRLGASSRER